MSTNVHRISVRSPWRAAFSLVELMIAVGLLSIIMVALMMALQQVQRAMHVSLNQVDVLENGRAIMTLISRDIQEITYSEDTNACNFFVTNRTTPQNRFGNFPSALQDFFVLTQTNNQWVSIKYSFDDMDVSSNYPVAVLYRKVNPSSPNDLPVTNILAVASTNVTETSGMDPVHFHRVADGIVHFKVQVLTTDGNTYDPTNSTPTMTIDGAPPDFQSSRFTSTSLPAFIDIEFGILEPQTLKEFNTRLEVDQATAIKYIQDHPGKVHLFRQRIPVRSRYRTAL